MDSEGGLSRLPPGLDGRLELCLNIRLMLTTMGGFFVGQIHTILHPIWDIPTKRPLYLAYV